jgi:hypothetical protein
MVENFKRKSTKVWRCLHWLWCYIKVWFQVISSWIIFLIIARLSNLNFWYFNYSPLNTS